MQTHSIVGWWCSQTYLRQKKQRTKMTTIVVDGILDRACWTSDLSLQSMHSKLRLVLLLLLLLDDSPWKPSLLTFNQKYSQSRNKSTLSMSSMQVGRQVWGYTISPFPPGIRYRGSVNLLTYPWRVPRGHHGKCWEWWHWWGQHSCTRKNHPPTPRRNEDAPGSPIFVYIVKRRRAEHRGGQSISNTSIA